MAGYRFFLDIFCSMKLWKHTWNMLVLSAAVFSLARVVMLENVFSVFVGIKSEAGNISMAVVRL